jgi:type I restriction enzyme S subunit
MSQLAYGWVSSNLEELGLPTTPNVNPENHQDEIFELYSVPAYSEGIPEILTGAEIGSTKQEVQPGDILLCKIVPHLIRVWVVGEKGKYRQIASGEWIVVRPPLCNEYYIRHLLMEPEFRLKFMQTVSGVGGSLLRARPKFVAQIDIPIAPLAEQQRIVAKLDSLFARTRQAREELENIPALIEHYKEAILATAFRGELTADWRKERQDIETAEELVDRTPEPSQPRGGREATDSVIEGRAALSVNGPDRAAPDGWAWVPLLRIARQETGHTPSRKHPEYWDGDIPWIGIVDAGDHHGSVIMDTYQHVTQAGLENSSARLLPKDTICLSRTASVGYVVRMGREMATSQDFVTWTCSEALDPDFLMYALMAEGNDIRRFGKGTTHTTIYFPEVRAMHICLAPLEEQREIVKRVREALAWVESVASESNDATELLPSLENSLLSKAFRGELVPQDPNDEPASVLLERIREARAEQSKVSKRKKRN